MSLELSICVFISFIQFVNEAQFLIMIFFLFAADPVAAVFGTAIVALTNIYASL